MKKWTFPVLCVVLFALVLAPMASAIVLCEDCPSNPAPWMRCIGFCNGQSVRFCTTWIAWNCPSYFAPTDASDKEIFLLSLEAQAAAIAFSDDAQPTEASAH